MYAAQLGRPGFGLGPVLKCSECIPSLRILIADDNPAVRRGVAKLLSAEPLWEICGEVANGDQILAEVLALRPNLILLDISMPGLSGVAVARLLHDRLPQLKIVIMSQRDPDQLRALAAETGADAGVDKARLASDLLPTIRSLSQP
jgi:DNA-binding NarL/FixJ family response regulator